MDRVARFHRALHVSSLILQQLLMLLRSSAAAETVAAYDATTLTPPTSVFSGYEPPTPKLPAEPMRRYIISAMQLSRTLSNWLPSHSNSLANAVTTLFDGEGPACRTIDEDKSGASTNHVYRDGVEEALGRALGILAQECITGPANEAGEKKDGTRTYFVPTLSEEHFSSAAPPLGLIAAIMCWTVQELDRIDSAHAASLVATSRLPMLPEIALRSLHETLRVRLLPTISYGVESLRSRLLR